MQVKPTSFPIHSTALSRLSYPWYHISFIFVSLITPLSFSQAPSIHKNMPHRQSHLPPNDHTLDTPHRNLIHIAIAMVTYPQPT